MSPERGGLPEPPWSQAPAEVSAWLASTGSRRPSRGGRPARQSRVRGFLARGTASAVHRLLHRLHGSHFEKVEGSQAPFARALGRFVRASPSEGYRGSVAGVRVRVTLGSGTEPRVRIIFTPRVTERQAAKILSRLGLDATQGSWL